MKTLRRLATLGGRDLVERAKGSGLGDGLLRSCRIAPNANATGGGGSKDSGSTTQKTEPWDQQKPYLQSAFQQAAGMYSPGGMTLADGTAINGTTPPPNTMLAPDYYSGQTVAPMAGETSTALDLQAQRALNGSPATRAAQNQLGQTMDGNYLYSNPVNVFAGGMASGRDTGLLGRFANGDEQNQYLDSTYDQAAGKVRASMDGGFSKAGRYGSGAHEAATGDALNNLATQVYGGAYEQDQNRKLQAASGADQNRLAAAGMLGEAYAGERGNQTKGMMFAPSLAAADYQDIAALSEVGAAREAYGQDQINADIDKYNYTASQPISALQNYLSLIQGQYGGTAVTKSKAASGNRLGGTLGGAASGAAIGSQIMPGYGTGIGAGIGGLMGYFGNG